MRITVANRLTPSWSSASDFARERYSKAFGADVIPAPDYFIVASGTQQEEYDGTDPADRILACVGMTFDSERGFFSERYLGGEPVEEAVARVTGATCTRDSIVEIGSLAGGGDRSGLELIRLTPIIAWCQGLRYILCTATGQLARTLDRLGIPFKPIVSADASTLDDFERERWGTYYQQTPRTGVIPLHAIGALLSSTTGRYRFSGLDIELTAGRQEKVLADAAA
ncbi:thermostable hemolysin [Streptomyces sp. NPDC007205]|uniref:thermostable hemolysin n=1 Tax=Streptomyces sp. NPDC007205 TaxID=3154316 RepID=UPI0033E1AE94